MAKQAGNFVAPCSLDVIGSAFAQQYYNILHRSPEQVHEFYHDESFLGRPDSNGTMTCVTTMHAIKEQILSADFTSSVIEIDNVDTQPSHKDGVLILVIGSFTSPDTVKRIFSESFFLAPQEGGGYFVLNDVLRYVPARPSTEINEALDNNVNENTQIATFPAEPETTSVKERLDPGLPSTENIFVTDKAINLSAADNSRQENNVGVETCMKVSQDAEISEAAPAPPASARKDVTKKYASDVQAMKEGAPPAPVAKPNPKPKATVKGAENVEKSLPSGAKPANAADSTPPSDKNVSDVQGYSVFVKNLPFNATVEMVEEEFRKFDAIKGMAHQDRDDDWLFELLDRAHVATSFPEEGLRSSTPQKFWTLDPRWFSRHVSRVRDTCPTHTHTDFALHIVTDMIDQYYEESGSFLSRLTSGVDVTKKEVTTLFARFRESSRLVLELAGCRQPPDVANR